MGTRLRAAGSQGQSWDFETEHELARQETLDALLKLLKDPLRVSGRLVITPLTVIPGIAAADALDAADALGTEGVFAFDVDGRPLPRKGVIIGGRLIDRDDDTLAATMHIFTETLGTKQTSDSALAIAAADAQNQVTVIPFTITTDVGAAKFAEVTAWDAPYYSASRKLWWQFSTGGTPTIASLAVMPMIQLYILDFD